MKTPFKVTALVKTFFNAKALQKIKDIIIIIIIIIII
jgi:hypothetical protein